ncbi:MAG: hypothetical protein O6850_03295 [Acidobacteria bacterium]|nr:hypothetical protein [Acidobacteriota bacterium]
MRVHGKKLLSLLMFGLMFGFLGGEARAQFNSPVADVAMNAVLNQSLTVTLDAAAVNFTMTNGSSLNAGDATISVTTAWTLIPSVGSVDIYAYFDDSTAALTNGTDDIPAANVEGSVDGGALTAFMATSPFGGVGVTVGSITITGVNKNSSQVNTLDLNINLTGLTLSAGTYTGTMHIQAQAL